MAQVLTAVADSSSLIALEQIGLLQTVEPLFAELLIPPAVAREITPTLPARPPWISERALQRPIDRRVLAAALGPGESEVISLALELDSYGVMIDERPARRLAAQLGLQVAGAVRVLLEAKAAGLLPLIRPSLDSLLDVGFFVSRQVIDEALAEAGEAT